MSETFLVLGDLPTGAALWSHRFPSLLVIGPEILSCLGHAMNGHRSTELIGTALQAIWSGSVVEVAGQDIRFEGGGPVCGMVVPRPRDHLLAEALTRETEAIGQRYVPDRHTDFDVEHGWRVTLEMGRGG